MTKKRNPGAGGSAHGAGTASHDNVPSLSTSGHDAATPLLDHPLAELFPPLEGEAFDALVADIKAHGLIEPITTFEEKILDGRNRHRACLQAGVDPVFVPYLDDDPAAFVISMNLKRRHLTAEQKRDVIAKLLAKNPAKSDRQIAEAVKASPSTVGSVRARLEAKGHVSNLDTRTDKRGRAQPARKPPKTKPAEAAPEATVVPEATAEQVALLQIRHEEQEPRLQITTMEEAIAALLAAFDVWLGMFKAKHATALEMENAYEAVRLEMIGRLSATRKEAEVITPSAAHDDIPEFLLRSSRGVS